jgi:excinuclease UvrABC ATPase subunit
MIIAKQRPKCPACYGCGTVLHPVTDEEVRCEYCDGERYDPYYTGKEDDARGDE